MPIPYVCVQCARYMFLYDIQWWTVILMHLSLVTSDMHAHRMLSISRSCTCTQLFMRKILFHMKIKSSLSDVLKPKGCTPAAHVSSCILLGKSLVGLLSKISTFLSIKWSISGFYLLCRFILFSSIFYHHSFIGLLACLLVHRCLFVCADVDRFITEAIISKGNWNLQQFWNYRIVLLYYRTTLIAPGSTANKCLILQ